MCKGQGNIYRSNQLVGITKLDLQKFSDLGIKYDYDLRTKAEIDRAPDELPEGVNYVSLDVLADENESSAAMLGELLKNPLEANKRLGNGVIDSMFIDSYRNFVRLSSAKVSNRPAKPKKWSPCK